MSLFKTNFMSLVEAFFIDHGYRVEICTIYTRGVDFFESYKRVILCAQKNNLLLCIKANSSQTGDPFSGSDEEIDLKLQSPALKVLSSVRALNLGIDQENCSKYYDLTAVPVIINEKASINHPVFYYYDGEVRQSKQWYKRKNVVFIPWEWLKNNWNEDFENSLTDQGLVISKPVKYEVPPKILETTKSIENIIATKRLGIIKTLHLDKPTLPPLTIQLRNSNLNLFFLIDEKDENIHPMLFDYAIYHYGDKITSFPSDIKAVFFNIISEDIDGNYLIPYVPKDTEEVKKQFSNPSVIKTTIKGFRNLLDIAKLEELPYLYKLPEIKELDINYLVKVSSGYFFESVFNEGKRRLHELMIPQCPFCGSTHVKESVSSDIVDKMKISKEVTLSFENSTAYYCPKEEGGCGIGFIIVHDIIHGGIHGFHLGDIHTYTQDYTETLEKIRAIGLEIHSFIHIDLE